jgi:dTMP kinase
MGNSADRVGPDESWPRLLAGKFIVFEGPDGSGKTTQLRRLVSACKAARVPLVEVREPGGTHIGERIREILLDRATGELSMRCEMLLYMASRAQLVEQRVRPALAEENLVIADRFVSSTLAYQGTAGGLPIDEIKAVARCAVGGIRPDLVIIFDVDEVTAARRMSPLLPPIADACSQGSGVSAPASVSGFPCADPSSARATTRDRGELDRIEARGTEFHRLVRRGYLEQAAADPAGHLVVDASKDPDQVWRELSAGLCARLSAAK